MEENAWGKMKKANAGNIDDCDRNKTFFFRFHLTQPHMEGLDFKYLMLKVGTA